MGHDNRLNIVLRSIMVRQRQWGQKFSWLVARISCEKLRDRESDDMTSTRIDRTEVRAQRPRAATRLIRLGMNFNRGICTLHVRMLVELRRYGRGDFRYFPIIIPIAV